MNSNPLSAEGRARFIRRGSSRGSGLVEVLVAMAIVTFMMIAVLEMFSLSLLTNHGSSARTEMTFKAQQVVENLRYAQTAYKSLGTVPAGVVGKFPLTAGTYEIPYSSTDSTGTNGSTWAYWGPSGANVMEKENGPYKISYSVQDAGGTGWSITVTVLPSLLKDSKTPKATYLGDPSKSKRIDYVAQIPQ